jgi:hypothetical protein
MVHADLICVPQLMSGEQALAAQAGIRAPEGRPPRVGGPPIASTDDRPDPLA